MTKTIANEIKEKIIVMYNDGMSSVKISKELNIYPSTIIRILRKNNIPIRSNKENSRKYTFDYHHFDKIDTPDKAYWLGFIYADGYISSANGGKNLGISLAIVDRNHLDKFNKEMKSNYPIHEYDATSSYSPVTKYCRVLLTDDNIYNDMIKHGVVEHKTLVLQPPRICEKFLSHFIRGYFDGDGCLTFHKDKKNIVHAIKIVGVTPILDMIRNFIEKNHVAKIHKYYQRRDTDNVYSLELGGNIQVKNFLDLIYKDANTYLDRKYERYINLCNLLHGRVIEKPIA